MTAASLPRTPIRFCKSTATTVKNILGLAHGVSLSDSPPNNIAQFPSPVIPRHELSIYCPITEALADRYPVPCKSILLFSTQFFVTLSDAMSLVYTPFKRYLNAHHSLPFAFLYLNLTSDYFKPIFSSPRGNVYPSPSPCLLVIPYKYVLSIYSLQSGHRMPS